MRACAVLAVAGFVLAWQAGGGIGGGRLSTVGPSPWITGLALGVEVLVAVAAGLGLHAAVALVRGRTTPLHVKPRRPSAPKPAEDAPPEAVEDAVVPLDEQPTEPIKTGRLAG
jgi:hypothetical protein